MVSLAVEAYHRRRAWAAYHAGYGVHIKGAKFEHLHPPARMAAKPQGEAMSPDSLLGVIRRLKRRMQKDFGNGE
jgi:hypothetical protein